LKLLWYDTYMNEELLEKIDELNEIISDLRRDNDVLRDMLTQEQIDEYMA